MRASKTMASICDSDLCVCKTLSRTVGIDM
ncbi:hypothetical protein F383_33430 [Gossypium arboreum]|uniref:Uncharacterized protein n=1 Tax=Gossypium arboreum TaxID=29729 RepID=A0A0B0PQ78_GOSAR|nr:hypothetical protein F383_33430 [Gossypium arboreum]